MKEIEGECEKQIEAGCGDGKIGKLSVRKKLRGKVMRKKLRGRVKKEIEMESYEKRSFSANVGGGDGRNG